ncbi:MAG: glycoside hydrolase family 3 C-terminal domain-containing protein [Phycisphaerales bacterium]|nr:MAG: glycoside hydrolase family 3 C-terminal domain-containing protein [Phycisphaerales bacterium]
MNSEYKKQLGMWSVISAALGMILVFTVFARCGDSAVTVFRDTSQSIDKRVEDLISRLTLEEKAMLLNHRGTTVERFNIRSDQWNQCLHGVCWDRPTTMFPVSIAMAATWDPGLVHEVATAISDEARAVHNLWHRQPGIMAQHKGLIYRAPVINIGRNPYWGRNEEAYGEDPFLTATMGVAYVKGLQGDHPRYLKLVSTLKHYAVNNVERDRQSLSATVSERMLHEYWLPHFRACIVHGRAQSVMASYNAINGVPNNINRYLLTDVLKDMWGFEGFVVSDLGGVNTMVRGHEKGQMSFEDAVAKSLIAGCDFSDREFEQYIPTAVRKGLLPESRVNDALRRVLRNRFLLGEFDPPEMVPYSKISPDVICSARHRKLALEAARKSIVLLTNKNGILPLDRKKTKSIAVIGPHADVFTPGGYSGRADEPVNPLQGVRNRSAEGTEVIFARGCEINERVCTVVDREYGFSRGASLKLDADAIGEFVEFTLDVPKSGTYEIKLQYKGFPSRGIYKLGIDGVDQGRMVDMYSPAEKYGSVVSFGRKMFSSVGPKRFRFTATGKSDASSSYTGHFDKIMLDGPEALSFELENIDYVTGRSASGDSIRQAAELARSSDVAIVCVGTDRSIEAEGRDRTSLVLPGRQEELIKAVLAANPKTIVVLMNAGPLTVPWVKEHAPAMLEAWWNGVETGNAIADVLFGTVNPAGRLPHTVYTSEDQVPPQDEYEITKGFTYMYLDGDPLFAFGHGLSYTQFEYSNLTVSSRQMPTDGTTTVSIDVKNTGKRAGDEVAQLYVRDVEWSVKRPAKELRGFKRITLEPGQKEVVSFALRGEQLAFWDEVETHDFIVEPGLFDIMIGASSADIRAKTQLEVVSDR